MVQAPGGLLINSKCNRSRAEVVGSAWLGKFGHVCMLFSNRDSCMLYPFSLSGRKRWLGAVKNMSNCYFHGLLC